MSPILPVQTFASFICHKNQVLRSYFAIVVLLFSCHLSPVVPNHLSVPSHVSEDMHAHIQYVIHVTVRRNVHHVQNLLLRPVWEDMR